MYNSKLPSLFSQTKIASYTVVKNKVCLLFGISKKKKGKKKKIWADEVYGWELSQIEKKRQKKKRSEY